MTIRRRWPRRVAVTAVALAVGLVGFALVLTAIAERRLAQALAATATADPRWTLDAIVADRSPLPDDRNGLLVLADFAASQVSRRLELVFSGVAERAPGEPIIAEHRAALAKWSGDIPDTLTLRRLADRPQGWRRIDTGKSPDEMVIEAWLTDMSFSRIPTPLWLAMAARVAEGDREGALQAWRAAWNVGRVIGDEPNAAGHRHGFRGNAHLMLERGLAQAGWADYQLAVVQSELAADGIDDRLLVADFRGMRAFADATLAYATDHREAREGLRPPGWGLSPGGDYAWQFRESLPGTYRRFRVQSLDIYNAAIEWATQPESERRAGYLLWATAAQPMQYRCDPAHEIAIRVSDGATSLTRIRCATAGVAVARYRLRTGRPPAKLDDLVTAGLLPAVPVDLATGTPLRLVRRGGGVFVIAGDDPDADFTLWPSSVRRPRHP